MSRNFKYINEYLDILAQDIYSQPPDAGHNAMLADVMGKWELYYKNMFDVLDVGCGEECIAKPYFDKAGVDYTGITLGNEKAMHMDMSFLDFTDDYFSGIFARHVLEHSPMPLLTLLEWHRVSSYYLFLVLPAPESYGYIGRNHYSVMPRAQIKWLLRRAGWRIVDVEYTENEYRFVCTKEPLISYEGYATAPLETAIYEADRDKEGYMNET